MQDQSDGDKKKAGGKTTAKKKTPVTKVRPKITFPTTIAIFPRQAFAITTWKCTITTPCWSSPDGVDGVKTGYTEAFGYNLVASIRRKEKHIVAVVLGETSRVKRDVRMRELIAQYIPLAVRGRTQIDVRKPRFERGTAR